MTKIEASLRTQTILFYKIFVRTGNPRYLGEKPNISFFTKFTKYGRGKLHSFETEIDAQACNVSYIYLETTIYILGCI